MENLIIKGKPPKGFLKFMKKNFKGIESQMESIPQKIKEEENMSEEEKNKEVNKAIAKYNKDGDEGAFSKAILGY